MPISTSISLVGITMGSFAQSLFPFAIASVVATEALSNMSVLFERYGKYKAEEHRLALEKLKLEHEFLLLRMKNGNTSDKGIDEDTLSLGKNENDLVRSSNESAETSEKSINESAETSEKSIKAFVENLEKSI